MFVFANSHLGKPRHDSGSSGLPHMPCSRLRSEPGMKILVMWRKYGPTWSEPMSRVSRGVGHFAESQGPPPQVITSRIVEEPQSTAYH